MITLRSLLFVLVVTVVPAVSEELSVFRLDVENFQEEILNHEMAVVAFYTKHSPYTPKLTKIFANLTEIYKTNEKLLVGLVDVDESAELTIYTDYNMIDIMIFYPEFVLNPLRFARNFTMAAIKDEVDYCWQYSNHELAIWQDMPKLSSRFMQAAFMGKGNASQLAEQARRHFEKVAILYEIINNATDDPAIMTVQANTLRMELFNMRRTQLNAAPQEFLDRKQLLFYYDSMMKLLFTEQEEMPKMKQKRTFISKKGDKKPAKKKLTQEVEAFTE